MMMMLMTSCRFLLFWCLVVIPSRAPALCCCRYKNHNNNGVVVTIRNYPFYHHPLRGGGGGAAAAGCTHGSGTTTSLAFAAAADASGSLGLSPRRHPPDSSTQPGNSLLWTSKVQPDRCCDLAANSLPESAAAAAAAAAACPMVPPSDHVVAASTSSNIPRGGATIEDSPSEVSDAYHLIWSPHVFRKVMITTPVMYLAQYLAGKMSFVAVGSTAVHSGFCWHSLAPNFMRQWMLPLLASSCCLLQLALNVISVGCAGFNTYLGPIRPYFLSLFLVLFTSGVNPRRRFLTVSSVLRLGVVFLPELVHVYNTWSSQRRVAELRKEQTKRTELPVGVFEARVELDIPTMGCVACINTIDATLRHHSTTKARVTNAASSLHPLGRKGGSAIVHVVGETKEALTELIHQLPSATERVGFGGATISSIRHSKIESNKNQNAHPLDVK